jgi:putative ABC transport system ATP-binding protein
MYTRAGGIQGPARNEAMVRFQNVKKQFPSGEGVVKALSDITFSCQSGEFVALVGASGSGKSTLLNILGGLERPDAGEVEINGQIITALSDDDLTRFRAERLGFVFQNFNLLPVLTAFENIEYPLLLRGTPGPERLQAVNAWLDQVGLAEAANRRPAEMSGGQRQRVAVARALVHKPLVVLADEPTANLDQTTGAEVLGLMKEINRRTGTTFIFATHDPKIVNLAGRVIEISDGRIVADSASLAR